MAMYKDQRYLQEATDAVFDQIHQPSMRAPLSGIYHCDSTLAISDGERGGRGAWSPTLGV